MVVSCPALLSCFEGSSKVPASQPYEDVSLVPGYLQRCQTCPHHTFRAKYSWWYVLVEAQTHRVAAGGIRQGDTWLLIVMGSLGVHNSVSTVHLISLDGASPPGDSNSGLEHDGTRSTPVCEHGSSTSGSTRLIQAIKQGLLVPSIPLSSAALRKLQQQTGSNSYTGHCNDAAPWTRKAAAADHADQNIAESQLLRSLPTELLYDDAGLQLFDQITYLPEYYLTSAEADILARDGPEIVRQCVADGTSMIELGAGSMRKTKLLLDAVVSTGLKDVSFFALDLCEQSLKDALCQLQGHFGGRIQLAGLVGTYQQGLAYIQQQQQQLSSDSTPAASGVKVTGLCPPSIALAAYSRYSSTAAGTVDAAYQRETSKQLAPAGPQGHPSWLMSESGADTTSDGNSTDTHDAAALIADDDCTSRRNSIKGTGMLVQGVREHIYANGLCHNTHSNSSSTSGSPGKLIMWLGSSIGNYNREEAAEFLIQVKDLAMQPGDLLLVGIDRRNNPQKVAEAYSDAGGVTNAFIMNGMKHCRALLNQALQKLGQTPSSAAGQHHAASAGGIDATSQESLRPQDFEYFCLYNDELGRHEAYYRATRDTSITVPIKAGKGVPSDSPMEHGVCRVSVAAGELIHIEFSYKYSQQEVSELAAAAGLKCVKAWTDSRQQFDLHLFSRGD